MNPLTQCILSQAQSLPEGGLLSPKEFLHLGSRAAIDQTFSRLTRNGKLLRVGRGAYSPPVLNRFGVRPPTSESILESIEATSGETIVASGAVEAHRLGLTTQVPTREIYLTSGVPRKLMLGNRVVALKKGNRVQMILGKRAAGKAIRALVWLGSEHAVVALKVLRQQLPGHEWDAMRLSCPALPNWLARAIRKVAAD